MTPRSSVNKFPNERIDPILPLPDAAPTIGVEHPMTPIRTIPSGHRAVDLPFDGSVVYLENWPDPSGERQLVRRLHKCLQRQNTKAAIALSKSDPHGARLFYLDRNNREHLYVLRSPIVGHAKTPRGARIALVVPAATASRLAAELRFYSHFDVSPSDQFH